MAIIVHWCFEKNIYGPPMAKNIYGPRRAENVYGLTMAKNIYDPQIAKNIYGPPILLASITFNTYALFKMKRDDKQNFLKMQTIQQK